MGRRDGDGDGDGAKKRARTDARTDAGDSSIDERRGDEARARGDGVTAREAYEACVTRARDGESVSSAAFVKWSLMSRATRLERLDDDDAFENALRDGLEVAMGECTKARPNAALEEIGRDKRLRAVGGQLALLLCQRGEDEDARNLLQFMGFTHRLGRDVLRYASSPVEACAEASKDADDVVRAFDDALDAETLRFLRGAFARYPTREDRSFEDRSFWRAHDYFRPTTGFFSYVHRLGDEAPENVMDVVVERVREIASRAFPRVKTARFAEWWAHARPHSDGHQLHFDSHDEGVGGVKHPICSAIVYVDGECGGPTLVTNQRDEKSPKLASCGWLLYPKTGRVGVFHGDYLHGVVPGRAVDVVSDDDALAARHRVTLMIAFWADMEVHSTWRPAGSARPFPPADAPAKWRAGFEFASSSGPERFPSRAASATRAAPVPVRNVWQRVDDETIAEDDPIPSYDACFQGF